jgi:hypothetical protein
MMTRACEWTCVQAGVPDTIPMLLQEEKQLLPKYGNPPRLYGSCALVGNARSLLGATNGEEIDAHDAVMRINQVRCVRSPVPVPPVLPPPCAQQVHERRQRNIHHRVPARASDAIRAHYTRTKLSSELTFNTFSRLAPTCA